MGLKKDSQIDGKSIGYMERKNQGYPLQQGPQHLLKKHDGYIYSQIT